MVSAACGRPAQSSAPGSSSSEPTSTQLAKESHMKSGYGKRATALSINTVVMFLLTYIMIADIGHFHANLRLPSGTGTRAPS